MLNAFCAAITTLQLWTAASPSAPIVLTIAYDGSASVPKEEFVQYPEMLQGVFELLKPGDTVVFLHMDRPQDRPETFSFDSRLSRMRGEVVQLYVKLREIEQSRGRHGTDIGLALDHLRRRIDLDRKLRPSTSIRYVVVAVTDGILDGRQTIAAKSGDPIGATDWRLVFLGVKPDAETRLRQLATENGFDDGERILVVPFSHWRQLAAAGRSICRQVSTCKPRTQARRPGRTLAS